MRASELAVVVAVVVSAFVAGSCSAARKVGPQVVHMVAEDCVEIAKSNGDGTMTMICATVDDLMPFVDAILSARKAAAARGDAGVEVDGSVKRFTEAGACDAGGQ
jgi:hypothetical protein